MPSENIAAEFSPNPEWKDGRVRCIAWHSHVRKFAVALPDDSVKIFNLDRLHLVPLLKHKLQKCVSDLAWRYISKK